MVLAVVVPIVVQNAITNFVSLLDNIMVGQVGTEQMSGVAIGNQLMFVFNLCIFGGFGGAGIFTSQYHGKGDPEGIRYTMHFKAVLGIILLVAGGCVFIFADDFLISKFLHDGSATGDLELTLQSGKEYLAMMLWGLVPFVISQIYCGTLREVGETVLPMKAGVTAVFVNLFLNWVFIYGNLGMPKLGVRGAALATAIARVVECSIVMVWAHKHTDRFPFMKGVWKSLGLPASLTWDIIRKGMPLLLNETIWALSMTIINQSYSTRGLAVVAAVNISSTVSNMFNVIFMAMGNALGIIVGKQLGQGKTGEAVDTDRKIIAFAVAICVVMGSAAVFMGSLFPQLYNTTQEVRDLAAYFIRISGLLMPVFAFLHCCYFTLRCGGKTGVTFLFDCGFVCCVSLPLAYGLAHFTHIPIMLMYPICQGVEVLKCILGYILVKKRIWVNNLVGVELEGEKT